MSIDLLLQQAASGATTVDTGDDDFANVVLLLDGDGTSGDANNAFTDSSTNSYTVTEGGSVVQGSFSPYGDNWSNYFDGSEYIMTSTAPPAIGTGDFTIEFWYNGGAQPNRYPCIVGTLDAFSATGAWRVFTYNNNANKFMFSYETTAYTFNTENYNDGVWRHFAVTREGTSLKGFVNGVQQGSTLTFSSSLSSRKILVAGNLRDNDHQEGFISNVRVVNGTALYTSNFTPPTEPLTAVTNTDFLACQSNRFLDNSTNNFAFTVSNSPEVSSFSPFKNNDARTLTTDGGSGYFTDSNAYLTASPAAPGTGDFCYECWINVPQGSDDAVWETRNANLSASGFTMTVIDADTIRIFSNNAKITANGLSYLNQWTHLCVEKVGSTTTMYINGTSYGTTTDFTNMSDTNFRVGDSQFYGGFAGYIADFRYVRGAYVYNGNFTPPTAPLTAIANTEVLLGFQDAGIYDRSGINNIDTVGDASLGFAPIYGTGFIDFDGGVDYLKFNDAIPFGTGDFTIESWINLTEHTNYRFIYDCRVSTQSSDGFALGMTGSGTLYVYSSGFVINSGSLPLNEWFHVALVRESGTLKTYINGSLVTSASYTNNCTSTVHWIGDGSEQIYDTNYSADDFRVTTGVARYTSNFTPPTEIDLSTDTHRKYVTLFLDGDGTVNGQNNTFTDSSTNDFTITKNGNVVQGVFSPYGDNWSNTFGSNNYYTAASDASFNLGTGDFTVEAWVNPTQYTTYNYICTMVATGGLTFYVTGGTLKVRRYFVADVLSSSTIPEIGEWTHVAATRSGTTLRIFVNGVQTATTTDSTNYAQGNFAVGNDSTNAAPWYGNISNLRVLKGTALYTSNFTPPTSPLTNITNTSILTAQSNRFVDNSSNSHALTITNTPKVSRFSPFESDKPYDITTDGGSGYFDGSGDYLTASDNAVFSFGTGDFTVEAWVYMTGGGGSIWSNGPTSAGSFGFYFQGTNELRCDYYGGTGLIGTTQVPDYVWHHVAVIRNGSTLSLYLNGAREATTTTSSNNTTDSFALGRAWTNHAPGEMQGYISDFRVVKGTALYTGTSYTVPTAPLTAVTNTSALLNFQDSAIPDLSGINNIDTVGNAKVAGTDPTKYGSNAMQFDGSGDYLVLTDDSTLSMGTGDFTVEFWTYATSTATYRMVLDNNWNNTTDAWQIYLNGQDATILASNGASASVSVSTGGNAVPDNQWTHLAFVKLGTNVKIYVNGTSSANGTMNVTFGRDSTNYIGIQAGASFPFVGYLDDLRITKGVARYTANFTPPDAALPKF